MRKTRIQFGIAIALFVLISPEYCFATESFLVGKWRSLEIINHEVAGAPSVGWEIEFTATGEFTLLTDEGWRILYERSGSYNLTPTTLQLYYEGRNGPWEAQYTVQDGRLRITAPPREDGAEGWQILLEKTDVPLPALRALPPLPQTVDEAVQILMTELAEEDHDYLLSVPKDDLILFHHGWGTGIRNRFGLWSGNDALLVSCNASHPDDASMVIIEAVWDTLRTQQNPAFLAKLDQQVHTARHIVVTSPKFQRMTITKMAEKLNAIIHKYLQQHHTDDTLVNFSIVLKGEISGVRVELADGQDRSIADIATYVSYRTGMKVVHKPPNMIWSFPTISNEAD